MAEVRVLPDDRAFPVKKGQTLLAAALKAGVPHTHACGGQARCSTCRVIVLDGVEHCSDPTWKETRIVKRLGFSSSFRLACQTTIDGDITVRRLVLDPADVALTDARDTAVPIGEEKDVAILFCDIRNFTPLAEGLLPYDVIHLLNRFHYDMATIIGRHGGIVCVTMGDGLMALFGGMDPASGDGEARRDPALPVLQAARAALDMIAATDARKAEVEQLYENVYDIGVGIHCGKAIVGFLGHQSVVPTAIGDCVNVASRIEGANKQLETRILLSEDGYQRVAEFITVGRTAGVSLKGKSGTFTLYEVTGLRGH